MNLTVRDPMSAKLVRRLEITFSPNRFRFVEAIFPEDGVWKQPISSIKPFKENL